MAQVDWIEAGKSLDTELAARLDRVRNGRDGEWRTAEEIQEEIDGIEDEISDLEDDLDELRAKLRRVREHGGVEREAEILIAHGRDHDGKIAEMLAEHRKETR